MTMHTTLPALTVSEIEGEPRVLDTDLGKALGFEKPSMIRTFVRKHVAALEAFGLVQSAMEPYTSGKGRVAYATAYHLNEEQALYVTMHCRTERVGAMKVGEASKKFLTATHRAIHRHTCC